MHTFRTFCACVVHATIPHYSQTEGLPAAMFNGHRPLHRRGRCKPAELLKFSGCDLLSWISRFPSGQDLNTTKQGAVNFGPSLLGTQL